MQSVATSVSQSPVASSRRSSEPRRRAPLGPVSPSRVARSVLPPRGCDPGGCAGKAMRDAVSCALVVIVGSATVRPPAEALFERIQAAGMFEIGFGRYPVACLFLDSRA